MFYDATYAYSTRVDDLWRDFEDKLITAEEYHRQLKMLRDILKYEEEALEDMQNNHKKKKKAKKKGGDEW